MGVILRYRDFLTTYKTRGHRIRHLEKYRYLFPIISSPALAGIVGDLIADGHLQGKPFWRIDFTSKNFDDLNSFQNRIKILFNIESKIRECKTNLYSKSFNVGVNCAPIARILFKIGVPSGQKVLSSFRIPEWIKKDSDCFKEFCKHFFACEGTIMHEKTRRFPQIRFEHWKSENLINEGEKFVKDICFGLEKYFGIKSSVRFPKCQGNRKDGVITKPIRVYILGESVLKFSKDVGFSNYKQQSLKAFLPDLN